MAAMRAVRRRVFVKGGGRIAPRLFRLARRPVTPRAAWKDASVLCARGGRITGRAGGQSFAAALYLRPFSGLRRLSVASLAHGAAMPGYRPPMKAAPPLPPCKRRKRRNVAPAIPIRPLRGGVLVSVEALYKLAKIALDIGNLDEADALFAAAKNAADADERAALRPYGTGGPAP